MKYWISSAIIIVCLSGCHLMASDHKRNKTELKKDIEILELKRRKAVLQVQLERVESIEIENLEKSDRSQK